MGYNEEPCAHCGNVEGWHKAGSNACMLPSGYHTTNTYLPKSEEKSVKIKPCPFCGDDPLLIEESIGYYVHCDCGVSLTAKDWTEKGALEIWNRRQ